MRGGAQRHRRDPPRRGSGAPLQASPKPVHQRRLDPRDRQILAPAARSKEVRKGPPVENTLRDSPKASWSPRPHMNLRR
eukprot:13066667-Alexandrium_andersonii.AAC.1